MKFNGFDCITKPIILDSIEVKMHNTYCDHIRLHFKYFFLS